MNTNTEIFASGCLVGALAVLAALLFADAFFDKFSAEGKRSSRLIRGAISTSLLSIAWISYLVGLDKSSAMLLMLLVILFCARLSGFTDVVAMSVFSVILLTYYVLPPVRDWQIASPKDKISLVLFVVTAFLASYLIRGSDKVKLFPRPTDLSEN